VSQSHLEGGGISEGAADTPSWTHGLCWPGLEIPSSQQITAVAAQTETQTVRARPRPWYRRWWVWTSVAAGAVIVSGAIVAGVLGSRDSPEQGFRVRF
jgi:hypothetical protein